MPEKAILNAAIGLLVLLYPLGVYFGLNHIPTSVFALAIGLLFAARLLIMPKDKGMLVLSVVMFSFAVTLWWAQSHTLLLYYPVIVNLTMLGVFITSLHYPPTVIERLARLREPNLSPAGVAYTRTVTKVWCFFFVSTPPPPQPSPCMAISNYGRCTTAYWPTC